MYKNLSLLFLVILLLVSAMAVAEEIDHVDSILQKLAENQDSNQLKVPPTIHSQLVGTWNSTDSNAKIVIISFFGNLYVRVYGACSPTPCDWGYRWAQVYATSVSQNVANGFTTDYDHGFATRIVTGKLINNRRLVVDFFTTMNDNRKNYFNTKTYIKQ